MPLLEITNQSICHKEIYIKKSGKWDNKERSGEAKAWSKLNSEATFQEKWWKAKHLIPGTEEKHNHFKGDDKK